MGGPVGRHTEPAARAAALALAAVLAACSPSLPSPSAPPATSVPAGTAAPSPAGSPTPATTSFPSPSPGPTPAAEAGWAALALPSPAPAEAALAPVRGTALAADPAAGFRLEATGATPLADLLARLRVSPPLDYSVEPAADGRGVLLRPAAPLAAGATYVFTLLGPAGVPLTGWAVQVAGPPRVVATIPGNEATDVPVTAAIEITFDRDDVAVTAADVGVRLVPDETAVAGRIEMHGRAAVFVPAAPLLPQRVYRVAVRAGTGAVGSGTGLARDLTFSFETARAAAGAIRVDVVQPLTTVLAGERPLLEVEAWQETSGGDWAERSSRIPVRVYRLAGETAALRLLDRLLRIPAWAGPEARPAVPTPNLRPVFEGTAGWVRLRWERRLRVPFAPAAGWYLVEAGGERPSQAVLQVTDVLGMAGAREDSLVAWVNDGRSTGPVAGATVEVVGGARLGRTGADGTLVAVTPAALAAAGGPVLVRMRAPDGRRVILELAGSRGIARDRYALWHREGLSAWWSAFATDRELYRPTDTIQAWGYLRARDGDRPPATVRLRAWRDADDPRLGRPVASAAATSVAGGAWVASLALRDLAYGSYLLDVVANGAVVETRWFSVGDLRKPPFEVEASVTPRAVIEGTPVTATISAHFFDGTPAAGIPVSVGLHEGDDGAGGVALTTDAAGTATAAVRPDAFRDEPAWEQSTCPSIAARPQVAAEAVDWGWRQICVFRGSLFVDVEATLDTATLLVRGAVHAVDLAAVEAWLRRPEDNWTAMDPRGAPASGRRLELRVTETERRAVVTSRWYDPVSKQVVEEREWEDVRSTTTSHAVTTKRDGTFVLRLPAAGKDRSWTVEAVVVDDAGRAVSARSWAAPAETGVMPWYGTDVLGRGSFGLGETVTARIARYGGEVATSPPSGGANRYLFVVGSRARFEAVVGRTPEVRATFLASDEPTLSFEGVWFTGRAYVVAGSATAQLRSEDRRITVDLRADRARYAPGQTATVTVRTTDAAGNPLRASVVVRGVDEKLVRMGVAEMADPLELLYRALPVGLVAGPAVSHPAWIPGGGGGGGATTGGGGEARGDFRDALPIRMVGTGADGTATIQYRLPDDITSWRVAAAALTADRRAGTGTVALPVGLPFFVDATIAPEYLVGDRVSIRLRAFGSALEAGTAVRFRVSSDTLAMSPRAVAGSAFKEALVELPPLTPGAHRVTIEATSAAGSDRLLRTFRVVESRLAAAHRTTVPVAGSTAPPGGPGLTRIVLADAGRARYVDLLSILAAPRGMRADERVAGTVARQTLVRSLGVPAADLPPADPFDRATYQQWDGGLALLPYGSSDLELTVRALLADPAALDAGAARAYLRVAPRGDGEAQPTPEQRAIALVGLAALGDPVLGELRAVLGMPSADGRTRLWAAIGLAVMGDRGPAASVEREALAAWGERRGDQVRLRIADDPEAVSEATELLALLAAFLDDPLAEAALAYVTAVPPRDDLAVLAQATVIARLMAALPAAPAVVALVGEGRRTRVEIPAGATVALVVDATRRAALRIEPVSGAAALTAWWEEPRPAAADLGATDPDLALTRTFSPPSPVAENRLVEVHLELHVGGPGRIGAVEVVEQVPSGLAAVEGRAEGSSCDNSHRLGPARIEGQRVVFEVTFGATGADPSEQPVVPGTFCLDYLARVVTAGTYAWEPALARQVASPGLVATTPAGAIELR